MDYVIAALVLVVIGLVVWLIVVLRGQKVTTTARPLDELWDIMHDMAIANLKSAECDKALYAAIASLHEELLREEGPLDLSPGALVEIKGRLHDLHNNLFWERVSVATSEEVINRPNGALVETNANLKKLVSAVIATQPVKPKSAPRNVLYESPLPAPRKVRKGGKG
jgi:hypothetical protein